MLQPKCESCFFLKRGISLEMHLYSLQLQGFFFILKYFYLSNIPIDSALLRNSHLHLLLGKIGFFPMQINI